MQKKIPQRQCMGCRERKAKRDMIRVVRTTEGSVMLDFSGKLNGRGAYVCPNPECLKKAQKSKAEKMAIEDNKLLSIQIPFCLFLMIFKQKKSKDKTVCN